MHFRGGVAKLAKVILPKLREAAHDVADTLILRNYNLPSNNILNKGNQFYRSYSGSGGKNKSGKKSRTAPESERNEKKPPVEEDFSRIASFLSPNEENRLEEESPDSAGANPEFFSNLSEISDDDLYSMLLMKNLKGVPSLPPLAELLAMDEKAEEKKARRELQQKRQQELEESRVQKVDNLGRAYATGRRKCSVARVWVFAGKGRFIVNGKPHDLYFPELDYRSMLLDPFLITKTLGKYDVWSTTNGGGKSGQAGALRHGISQALQLYDPTLRPALKSAGFLTRDPRMVERKKPGKAKARKSFQWVKR